MKKIKKIAFIGIGLINSSLARDLMAKSFTSSQLLFQEKKTRNILKKLKIVDKVEDSYEAS